MDRKDKPLTSMSKEEREEVWDDVFAKEEGIIIEFDIYGYNYRRGSSIPFRYDNSPDRRARHLNTCPHHKHVQPDKLVPSDSLIDLSAVLEEIEGMHTKPEG